MPLMPKRIQPRFGGAWYASKNSVVGDKKLVVGLGSVVLGSSFYSRSCYPSCIRMIVLPPHPLLEYQIWFLVIQNWVIVVTLVKLTTILWPWFYKSNYGCHGYGSKNSDSVRNNWIVLLKACLVVIKTRHGNGQVRLHPIPWVVISPSILPKTKCHTFYKNATAKFTYLIILPKSGARPCSFREDHHVVLFSKHFYISTSPKKLSFHRNSPCAIVVKSKSPRPHLLVNWFLIGMEYCLYSFGKLINQCLRLPHIDLVVTINSLKSTVSY